MRLDNFDLNLLVAFDTLLHERNVTRAAARLNVTQSAMSASLKRLRESFQDEILAQHGRRMVPTPFALSLQPEIGEKISELRALIARKGRFNPESSDRHFKIAGSDYITTVLLNPLLNALASEAPSIKFDFDLPSPASQQRLANGELDLMLAPKAFSIPGHPSQCIFTERHVAVAWSENPLTRSTLSRDSFVEAGHVGVSIAGRFTFAEDWLHQHGIERRIEVRAPSFIQAPFLVPGTMRLCVMHERLAKVMAEHLPLKVLELPFDLPPMEEMMQYHSTREADLGLLWLREKICALAPQL